MLRVLMANLFPVAPEIVMARLSDVRRLAIPDAVKAGEIRPVFQPILSLRDRSLAGFEVLSRWMSPVHGPISPIEFIPWAEEDGVIDDLTHAVLSAACIHAAGWGGSFFMCINVSPLQFSNSDIVSLVLMSLEGTGFARHRLIMEMTETASIAEASEAHEMIANLGNRGVRLALDDFGSGHSGLNRLLRYPFHTLKIDKGLVKEIETNIDSRTLVAALIGLCNSLGLDVIAEGIETEGQLAVLQAIGCTFGQGWLLGRELNSAAAASFVRLHSPPPGNARLANDTGSSNSVWSRPAAAEHQHTCGDQTDTPGLDMLFSLSDIGLCQIDPQMRIVRMNQSFAELFDRQDGPYDTPHVSHALPPDVSRWLQEHARRLAVSDDTFVYSLTHSYGRIIRLRIRRMITNSAFSGILLIAVPN